VVPVLLIPLALSLFAASSVFADPCPSGPSLPGTASTAVLYEARPYEAGYRFALGGVEWELQETTVSDEYGRHTLNIIYPRLIAGNSDFAASDFFFSVDATESDAVACSDMPADGTALDDWMTDTTLYVTDDYWSHLRPPGVLSDSINQLQSRRTMATTLRVRQYGVEVVVATGFASTRMMDLRDCIEGPGDSIGIVENRPGEIHITCYPENPSAEYVSNIDWVVDYQWPSDAPALIDELIDYVHVEITP
jgi:hypothetical protein